MGKGKCCRMRFEGFTNETFEFFMALRFNNNRDFFHENHDWYLHSLREPCLALAEALGPAALRLNKTLDTRPDKVVSRINRDLRYSKDKAPYRDYIWLSFHRQGEDRDSTMGAYFDMSDSGASCGVGLYMENKPLMSALRRELRTKPEAFLRVLPKDESIKAYITAYKRLPKEEIPCPDGLNEVCAKWYNARSFYFQKDLNDFSVIKSPQLVDIISAVYDECAPLFRYFDTLQI